MIHAWEAKVELFTDNIDTVILLATLIKKSSKEGSVHRIGLSIIARCSDID